MVTCCGPKCSICCAVLSGWGIIMLVSSSYESFFIHKTLNKNKLMIVLTYSKF